MALVREATYNLGDMIDLVAEAVPERIAIVWADHRYSFAELKERSDRLAAAMVRAGIVRGDRVGLLMHNCPAYIEALLAAFKIGAVTFNINYRYVSDELFYILNNAGASALIHGSEFEDPIAQVLPRLPALKLRIVVETEGTVPTSSTEGVIRYSEALAVPVGAEDIVSGRSGEDTLLIYTGGTTGMPKGVEWSNEALFFGALGGITTPFGDGPVKSPQEMASRALTAKELTNLAASPLMHGAALWGSLQTLLFAGRVVLGNRTQFDAEMFWDLIEREKISGLSVTGDAMAFPMIEAWDANPGRWDASHLLAIRWGGAPLSPHFQQALKERFPQISLVTGMGSTESGTLGIGNPNTQGDGFTLLPPRHDVAVIVDAARFAEPGEIGILARTGFLPNGYWGDPEKTAATFIMLDGRRWVLTGDRAKLESDGVMRIYGRDSTCINSGGEKIFPEEVEAAIRSHPAVVDVVVVGIPDLRWGQLVTCVAALRPGRTLTIEELRDFCTGKLARFKLPQKLVVRDTVKRSPAGKHDITWAREQAIKG